MGLNICVHRFKDGRYFGEVTHEQWDSVRHAGDREFANQILNDKSATDAIREDGLDGEWYFRPRDIEKWKKWDAAYDCNNGRWSRLADLLASDPDLFVYQSW